MRHLAAVANEADLDLDLTAIFEEKGKDAALLAAIRPNGTDQWGLEEVGGYQAVLKTLAPRLHTGPDRVRPDRR